MEERTVEVLRQKRLLFDEVVEGAGIRLETALTRDELMRVVGFPAAELRRGD